MIGKEININQQGFDELVADLGLAAEGILGAAAVEVDNLEEGLALLNYTNASNKKQTVSLVTEPMMMYFYFSQEGQSYLTESLSNSTSIIDNSVFRFFANPRAQATLALSIEPRAKAMLMLISLKKLHEFFIQGPNAAERTSSESLSRSFRGGEPTVQGLVSPSMSMVLNQMGGNQINAAFLKLYRKGKVLEFFSLYLDQSKRADVRTADCPYVANEMDVDRIHQARAVLEQNMAAPPSLPELARQTGLNEFKLKVGFKQVYGNTVYGYLNDMRMEAARRLLEARKMQVKEVSFTIGYNNPSHFISAFKKKYGITPNKYMEG